MDEIHTARVSQREADFVALALDIFLNSSELDEDEERVVESLLLQFDYISDPESFLQYVTHLEHEEEMEAKAMLFKQKIVGQDDNVISVDFGKE